MMKPLSLLSLSLLVCGSHADGTYRSRPDLAPPRLNITIPCQPGVCESGYLFVAPFTSYGEPDDRGTLQTGPYILTDAGDLVWSGFSYFAGWVGNFQAARWQGRDVLFAFEGVHNGRHGHGHGHHTILSQHYDVLKELRAGGHMLSDKHEFIIVGEKTALIQIYHPMQMDLAPYGGDGGQTWVVDARFQELDIESGKVLFEWRSLDHCSPNESALPLSGGLAGTGRNSSTAWDYFHINSIAKGADGHYLLSARHASTIFKINGTSGAVIWRLGGNQSDFAVDDKVTFGFQHHARFSVEGGDGGGSDGSVVSLFDNSVYGSESAGDGHEVRINAYSQGKYISLNYSDMTASLLVGLKPPALWGHAGQPILTRSQGSLQTFASGGSFVNWGSEGQLTEYDATGKPVFHAFLGQGFLADKVQNYRAFRYNWTGISPEPPAVVAEESSSSSSSSGGDGLVNVYVSWNGDTLTRSWKVSWLEELVDDKGNGRPGAMPMPMPVWKDKAVPRTGFETRCKIPRLAGRRISSITAEALDDAGGILSRSSPVVVQRRVRQGGQVRRVGLEKSAASQNVLDSRVEIEL